MNIGMVKKLEPSKWSEGISEFRATRRYLPHLQSPGGYYFTDSNTFKRITLSEADRRKVLAAILFHDGSKYTLEIAVVMPDHFHMLLAPLQKPSGEFFSLEEIFHSIKSFTAHKLRMRRLWQDENYDHLIRDERDFWARYEYILYNPVEASLVERAEDYEFLYFKGM
jgi:REP element-mobilizing transposase RayT